MKKYLFILFAGFCIYSCTPSNYTITGTVDNKAMDGTKIFIKERVNRIWISLDSAVIENGKFNFNGIADSAKITNLVYEFPSDNKVKQAFVLENGKITVKIDTAGFMVFKGTEQNDELQSYQDKKNKFNNHLNDFFKSHANINTTNEQQLAFAKEEEKLNLEEVSIDKKFVIGHLNKVVGTYVFMNSFYGWTTAEKDSVMSLFNKDTKKITRIKEILADIEIEKKVSVGNQFIDFRLPNVNGDSISLSAFVGKTDYLMVDFWASWCGPCIQSLPELKKLYSTYNGSRFEILGVSLDDNKTAWTGAISSHQLKWKHVSDLKGWNCTGSRAYAVNSIPNTVLINKDGEIVGRNLSIPEIAKLLSGKTH